MRFFRKRSAKTLEHIPSSETEAAVFDAVQASGFFDPEFYLLRYPEIRSFRKGPLVHFCQYGIYEHRDPGPNFDTRAYLDVFPEAGKLTVPTFLHVLGSEHIEEPGLWLARDIGSLRFLLERSGLFDAKWYKARNPDLVRVGLDPISHLLDHGMREWRDPGPGFETAFYAESHPSFLALGLSPLEHFLRIGRAAGYTATGLPKYERWVQRFQALSVADEARIAADAAVRPLPAIAWYVSPNDADTDAVQAALAAQVGAEPRLVGGEPGTTLAGLADGTVLILIGSGARLRPQASYVLARALESFGMLAAYSDHDRIDDAGVHSHPVFKPAMAPDFMARLPYAGPVVALTLTAETRARATQAFTTADPSAAWARLLLSLPATRVMRVPMPLYSLLDRAVSEDGEEGVYEPVATRGLPASALHPNSSTEKTWPPVRIVIPTRDRLEFLEACLDSLFEHTTYPRDRMRVVVVDNDSKDAAALAYLNAFAARPCCTVLSSPGPFNFAKICNDGAAGSESEILVFLNNDTTILQPDWLDKLAHQAARHEIGAVGAQLLYPDRTVQHGGVILGIQGVGGHRLVGVKADRAAQRDVTREMVAVTGACLAIRAAVFEELGGFDERLGVAFNDTALCVRAHEVGYRNLYIAEPLLIHHESKSRGFDDSRDKLARQRREATYVRERYGALFRDDPSYSPNLSLQNVGHLAVPPRVVRPWRRSKPGARRALILSSVHGIGHGVAEVVAQQAAFLVGLNWEVIVGGPTTRRDRPYPGCRRVAIWTSMDAAALAVEDGVDCIIAHTPPFFSVTRFLGRRPLVYLYDHGEPPPELFVTDRIQREDVDWEKRFVAPLARRTFVISRAIRDQQFRRDAVVLRNGNSHLSSWTPDWARRRADLRAKFGFAGRFVVLNVCRFGAEERRYKGIDAYIKLLDDLPFIVPDLAEMGVFAQAGRGDHRDIAHVKAGGLTPFANVTDVELAELYAASDLYLSLSQWEGYNLGIGQALAMGLPVVASDIPAHREFGIDTASTTPRLCALIAEHYAAWDEAATARQARIEPWEVPLARMAEVMEADCAEEDVGPWY
ncbi:glycosyltransferase [Methylobacterium sp. HMF5984]|uniref:glycosyltransferase n=1 Tax=Methylobacterium sp. HMF5984 TaxID=3367370 RepID=UPI0038535E9A